MNLESQITSLELNKKLHELGVKKESFFKWYISDRSGYSFIVHNGSIIDSQDNYSKKYSAYSASELLELLPTSVNGINLTISTAWSTSNVKSEIICMYNNLESLWESDENLSNALAKMLIHLIEKKIIEV